MVVFLGSCAAFCGGSDGAVFSRGSAVFGSDLRADVASIFPGGLRSGSESC
jgi:hypothetical protein